MLKHVQVRNMRRFGPDGARLELGALTVLVGPNNAGKSTLMDAAFLASSRRREADLGRIVRRRVGLSHAARWLVHAGSPEGTKAEIIASFEGGEARITIGTREQVPPRLLSGWKDRAEGALTALTVDATHSASGELVSSGETVFDARNAFRSFVHDRVDLPVPGSWLIDTKLIRDDEQSVAREFSQVVEQDIAHEGRLVELLKQAVPSLTNLSTIRLLLNPDGLSYLAYGNGRGPMLPVASMGDGARVLFRIALDAAAAPHGSLLLIEEPELHQHPGAVRALANLILALPKRGIQVVVTTHSPVLLNALCVAGQEPEALDLCVATVTSTGKTPTIEAIRGLALRTGWTEFARRHLTSFDSSYAGI